MTAAWRDWQGGACHIAPFVLRALHPAAMHGRCDRLDRDYEEIGDNLAKQAIAAFGPFLAAEHEPWRRQG